MRLASLASHLERGVEFGGLLRLLFVHVPSECSVRADTPCDGVGFSTGSKVSSLAQREELERPAVPDPNAKVLI